MGGLWPSQGTPWTTKDCWKVIPSPGRPGGRVPPLCRSWLPGPSEWELLGLGRRAHVRVVRATRGAPDGNVEGEGRFLLGLEVRGNTATSFTTRLLSPFWGCENLVAFSEAAFKTDISVGGKSQSLPRRPPALVFAIHPFSFFLLLFLFSSLLSDSSFTFCYSVSFAFVSRDLLH